jgi:hypothetical protein
MPHSGSGLSLAPMNRGFEHALYVLSGISLAALKLAVVLTVLTALGIRALLGCATFNRATHAAADERAHREPSVMKRTSFGHSG